MSKFEVGDLVKGLPESNHRYSITNENMTKGVVKKITENGIVVNVLEHAKGRNGVYVVDDGHKNIVFVRYGVIVGLVLPMRISEEVTK